MERRAEGARGFGPCPDCFPTPSGWTAVTCTWNWEVHVPGGLRVCVAVYTVETRGQALL